MYTVNINQREKREEEYILIMSFFLLDVAAKTVASPRYLLRELDEKRM